jgi:hypothetical protein
MYITQRLEYSKLETSTFTLNFYKERFRLLNNLSNKLNTKDIKFLEKIIIKTNEIVDRLFYLQIEVTQLHRLM